ncbi:MAG TPA: right-handed parallel beta-helix repeat-containing protein [Thermoanaerobaculia bacterium]|nr:right-handed parallel beta-helix repeat-containing protein [Thermoanaerobaculia bacterium]
MDRSPSIIRPTEYSAPCRARTAAQPADSPARAAITAACLALLLAAPLSAATFTVGPGGTHATIQAAIDTALATPGDHHVRVQKGIYEERLTIGSPQGALIVSGGWDAAFAVQDPTAPNETIVNALGDGRALHVSCTEGRILLSNLMLTGGHLVQPAVVGGGVAVFVQESCDVTLSGTLISENRVDKTAVNPPPTQIPLGGGIYGFVANAGRLEVRHSILFANELHNTANGPVTGAGGYFHARDNGIVELRDNRVNWNVGESLDPGARGGGLFVEVIDAARAELVDNLLADNRLTGPEAGGSGAYLSASFCGGCGVELVRSEIRHNDGGDDGHLVLSVRSGAAIEATDSLIARGDGNGVLVDRFGGDLTLTNLTVANHPGNGLEVVGATGTVEMHNTILFANGTNVVGLSGVDPSNLVGTDPIFVDHAGGDYHLALTSPAIDAGDDTPPGGLGTHDLDGGPRVQGPHVDIGAYEARSSFCYVEGHGSLAFVEESAPVCSCLQDDLLRSLRCGFTFPGFFVDIELPWPVFPGDDTAAQWTLHPWGPVDGPYELQASLLVEGQEIPLDPQKKQGTFSGQLKEGKDVSTELLFPVPNAAAALSVRLLLPALTDQPSELVTGVLLHRGGE